ncbi:MAG: penicillin-binding protein 2 [Verrucomicrobia bacterium]|nr:penicillin-binding protein 2 [Verrucomicrobiota bacterium]
MNPGLSQNLPILSRAGFLNSGVGALFVWLAFRLVRLGSGRDGDLLAQSLEATGVAARSIPHRGEILDRNGCVLAVSEPVVSVCVNPSQTADRAPQLAAILEPHLQIPQEKLLRRLQPRPLRNAKGEVILDRHGKTIPDQWELLKSNISLPEWQEIRQSIQKATFGLDLTNRKQKAMLKTLRTYAIFAVPAQVRRYRLGALAAHVIGHVTVDSGNSPFFVIGDIKVPTEFAALLRVEKNPVSEFLFAALTEPARDELSGLFSMNGDRTTLQKTLVAELNRIIQRGPIYHPERFTSVPLDPETVALLYSNPEGLELVRLNRLLLADAYPNLLARHTPVLPLQVGAAGIERSCEHLLCGEVGWRRSQHDARGRELPRFREEDIPVRDGLTVGLTLDARVQRILEDELAVLVRRHAPASATGLIVNPATGDLLACATLPHYLPERPGESTPETWRNRAICDVHELGSVMKMVTVIAALDLGILRLNDVIFCENGIFHYKGKTLRDHHPYGNLTVEEILVHSSNVGAAKIALRVGEPWLHHYFSCFGFGKPTGILLPGERSGTLHPVKSWSGTCITRVAIGYAMSATPLQLAMAYSALGNNGVLMRPRLLESMKTAAGICLQRYPVSSVRSVAKPEVCRSVLSALTGVVSPNGTAPKAAVPDFTAAGKTGTAEIWRKQGRVSGGYVASFVGLLPASLPRLCITIVVDNPKNGHFGGTVCGLTFAQVARRSAQVLNIPPDNLPMDNHLLALAR